MDNSYIWNSVIKFSMKVLYFLSCFIFVSNAFAQNSKRDLRKIEKAAQDITVKEDEFDGTTRWTSPYLNGLIDARLPKAVRFLKVKNKDGSYSIYLTLTSFGQTLNVGEKGATLLFEDGTRFEKPSVKIDVENRDGIWEYTMFERITEEELEMFVTKKVDKFRLFIYENQPIRKIEALRIMGYARGIKEVK